MGAGSIWHSKRAWRGLRFLCKNLGSCPGQDRRGGRQKLGPPCLMVRKALDQDKQSLTVTERRGSGWAEMATNGGSCGPAMQTGQRVGGFGKVGLELHGKAGSVV